MFARLAAVVLAPAVITALLAVAVFALPATAAAKTCVWRVTTSPDNGRVLYLAGSVHALRRSDLPLPAAYDRALAASGEVVFETDPSISSERSSRILERAATLPGNATLRDRVDPRTYAYLQRVLARARGSTNPEQKIARLRPWALGWMLESPSGMNEVRGGYGVDRTLEQAARRAGKRVSGLVSMEEHIAVFGDFNDQEGEAYLLLQFIQLNSASAQFARTVAAWRRGDTDTLDRTLRAEYRAVPSLYDRLLTRRNRRWLPKVEGYLRGGGPTRLVVAGAGHMSGPDGLPALLSAAGYRVEQQ